MKFRLNSRTIPKLIAWIMLTFVFLSMLINTFSSSEEQSIVFPKHYTDRVMHVGTTFVKEWLTINPEEKLEDYRRRISPFLKTELVNSQAGLTYSNNPEFSQKVDQVWSQSVTQLDGTHYTSNVGVILDTNGIKRRMVVNVPVEYIASADQFVIYENPGFSPLPSVASASGMDFGEEGSVANMNQLRTTLTNFFTKYINEEDQAELANFLVDNAKGLVHPKGGIVSFKSIDSIKTFPRGQSPDGAYAMYMGKVKVSTTDNLSGIDISSDYIVVIYEQGDRYLIGNISP